MPLRMIVFMLKATKQFNCSHIYCTCCRTYTYCRLGNYYVKITHEKTFICREYISHFKILWLISTANIKHNTVSFGDFVDFSFYDCGRDTYSQATTILLIVCVTGCDESLLGTNCHPIYTRLFKLVTNRFVEKRFNCFCIHTLTRKPVTSKEKLQLIIETL